LTFECIICQGAGLDAQKMGEANSET